jgi:thiamine-phosphate pyrophosphorylase
MPFKLPAVYPITNVRLSGLSHAEQVTQLIAGGANLIQLREKDLTARDFYGAAATAVRIARKHKVRLIINDRVDIAMALTADGVHLGQTDLPPEAVRRLLGDNAIIGFSTHNLEQIRLAAALPISYLALGPIFETSSKRNPDPVVGLDGLRRARGLIEDIPLVAIGGITRENAQQVFQAGADSVAMIGGLVEGLGIESRTRQMLALAAKQSF